jgi:hypothetical protein
MCRSSTVLKSFKGCKICMPTISARRNEFKDKDILIVGTSHSAEDIVPTLKYGAKSITVARRLWDLIGLITGQSAASTHVDAIPRISKTAHRATPFVAILPVKHHFRSYPMICSKPPTVWQQQICIKASHT